jgi:serine/threonine protein kinase
VQKDHGKILSLPPYEGRIHPDYDHPVFREAISKCGELLNDPGARIIQDTRNRVGAISVPLNEKEKKEIVIKEFRIQGINKIKSLFLSSKSLKAWRGGMSLLEGGIQTPFPIAHMERRNGRLLEESYYLAEFVDGLEEIRGLFRSLPENRLKKLVEDLALFLARCRKKGIIHKDLSDGNILVRIDQADQFTFYIIDTNRIRKRPAVFLQGVKYLVRLGIPYEFQKFFLSTYSEEEFLPRRYWFWYRMNKSVYTHYVELKKKLRLKQISQRLKIQ